ncbi:hypothetical protein [Glycomyces sp. NPDC021274]|jgi:hypothetical protein|uniref:hypothetical protein n=1 Tax=Glycomyces sp. NPDC021274 TaxID=3155120 RepID=UPI0033CCEC69
METTPSKPVYHRPMPWHIVVALVVTGLDALALAFMAAGLAAVSASAPRQFQGLLLMLTALVALVTVVYVSLGVCIAARLNKARKLAIVLNLVFFLAAVGILIVLAVIGEFYPAALASGALSLFMIALLSNERSQAYTYKSGEARWPED